LLVTLLVAVAAVTLLAAVVVYRLTRREIDDVFDYHLRQIALSLRDQTPAYGAPGLADEGFDFVIQIWGRNGERLYLSRRVSGLPEVAELGFATVRSPAGSWRVYSAQLGAEIIQVAQPLSVRQRLAFAAAARTLAPVLLILPLLTLLVWRIVGRAFEPLDRLARSVGSRSAAALDPISEVGAPEEALPLVRSLNDLLARLGAALASQRAFVADAAHELRTPLAALKLQAQLVQRAAGPEERATAVADLMTGLDRATHVVQQLLTLARAEPDAASAWAREPVPLADVVAQVVADHALLSEAKRVDLGAKHVADGAVVLGDSAALRTLVANLVENAVRYVPEGGRVDLSASLAQGRPYLEVTDDGPGIPEAERARVFDRFYRRSTAPGGGSGLGLAIVEAIAQRHGATVSLRDTPGGGLTVRLEFPPCPAQPEPSQPEPPRAARPAPIEDGWP
jgi:two-component system OmpR family sensor kinase